MARFHILTVALLSTLSLVYAQKNTAAKCGSTVRNDQKRTGYLKTPGYRTRSYPNNLDCTWTLELNEKNQYMHIKMKMKIEAQKGCNRDYIIIYDDVTDKMMGKFCGDTSAQIVLPSHKARVVFRTDGGNTERGAKIQFVPVGSNQKSGVMCAGDTFTLGHCIHCSGTIESNGGVIQSPFFGDIDYPNNMFCEWRIQTGSTKRKLQLQFETLDMDTDTDCRYDNVKIYDAQSRSPMATICGNKCNPSVVVPFGAARVTFTSDSKIGKKGFKLTYKIIKRKYSPEVGLQCGCDAGEGCFSYDTSIKSEWFDKCIQMYPKLGGSDTVGGTRIHGGTETEENELPYQVLINQDGQGHCGGSIIHNKWILTAAHCFPHTIKSRWEVMVGGHNIDDRGGIKTVKRIILHQGWNVRRYTHDIALIELDEPLEWLPHPTKEGQYKIAPICLTRKEPVVYTKCTISGWGKTESGKASDVLLKAEVPIVAQDKCSTSYGRQLQSMMVCAGFFDEGKIDACQGDSGGPLVCRLNGSLVLQGVTSWGKECGLKSYPGIYTRVAQYIDWISDITGIVMA